MAEPRTLPGLLLNNAAAIPTLPAIREKTFGIWETYNWREYHDQVRDFALGLAESGFQRGDKLAVIGDNRPRLYWAQLAAQALGGIPVPVYQDAIAKELVFVLNHAEVAVIVAEDQEQVDKILSIKDELPALRLVVYDDPRGMAQYDLPWLTSFEETQEKGRDLHGREPSRFEREIAAGKSSDVALLCYTSGTTGNPKGAMLTHENAIATAEVFAKAEDVRQGDDWLAYLPMAWVGDSIYSLVLSLLIGAPCNCPESPETVQRDLRELGPTGIIAPPRIWENMLSMLQVKAADAPPLKRWVFERFRRVAGTVDEARAAGKPVSFWLRIGHAFGEFLVYGPVRDQLGLRRARWAYTGGAPLGPDTLRFFRSIGVNLKQIYGSTEVSGLVALQPDAEANPDTVGPPCPGVEVRISEQGEVQVKSPGIFAGYYKAQEATQEVLGSDGWFRTGDAGLLDDRGHLIIIDRAKDVGQLENGTPFAPQFIENKLKFSPFIREAVAFGHQRSYVAAMIAIDFDTVGNWAERRGLPYTNYMDLSQKPDVRVLVRQEIEKCNSGLPSKTQVRRFLLLAKDFDADDSEITRTRKLRRKYIAEKYGPVIDAFYSGSHEVEIETPVTFEDGRQTVLRNQVTIQDIGQDIGEEARAHG